MFLSHGGEAQGMAEAKMVFTELIPGDLRNGDREIVLSWVLQESGFGIFIRIR